MKEYEQLNIGFVRQHPASLRVLIKIEPGFSTKFHTEYSQYPFQPDSRRPTNYLSGRDDSAAY